MFKTFNAVKCAFFICFFSLPVVLSANPVGQAIGVIQDATLEQAGGTNSLQQGQAVALGDVITTGQSGQVQLLFQDETKIAMSANSRLVIENILFNSSNTASTFAVNAVGGAFRFLSGNSDKSAYSVNTPNGTMGIRGTVFDFHVFPQGELGLVTFRGEVRLCNRSNQCVRVRGGCAAVLLDNSGQFVAPRTNEAKAALLSRGFPYIERQRSLFREFRAPISSCTSQTTENLGPRSAPGTPPSPPQNPNVGGAQAGNNTGAGFGGASANGVDAGAGGPSGPGDADASSGGASAGGASAGGGSASAGSN